MRDRLVQLGSDTVVVLVVFTDPANIAEYQATNQLPFPILVDVNRSSYQAYGLGRTSTARVYSWKTIRRYLEIFRTSGFRRLPKATEDTLQLGGDFIIAPDQTLAYGFWSEGPDDRPDVEELVEALDQNGT